MHSPTPRYEGVWIFVLRVCANDMAVKVHERAGSVILILNGLGNGYFATWIGFATTASFLAHAEPRYAYSSYTFDLERY